MLTELMQETEEESALTLGLIRSSSPQSEATNTALIESPSEKKHSKKQTHRRPKKGRETKTQSSNPNEVG
jgi:hypothetical protein